MSLRIKRGMRLVYCGASDHMKGVKGLVVIRDGYHDSLFLRADCRTWYRLPSFTGVWEELVEDTPPAVAIPQLAVGQVWKGDVSGKLKTIEMVKGGSVKVTIADTGYSCHLGEHFFLKNHTFVSESLEGEVDNRPAFVRDAVAEMCPDGKKRYFLPVTHFNWQQLAILLEGRYVKFVATGIKRIVDTTTHTHKAFLDDESTLYYEFLEDCGSASCSIGFMSIPKVWPLQYAGEASKRKKTVEKPAIDKRKFILWNPKHPSPPKVIMEGMAQAKEAAESMANKQDATFYICELVAVTKTTKVTTRTVSVEEL